LAFVREPSWSLAFPDGWLDLDTGDSSDFGAKNFEKSGEGVKSVRPV
jgi:hypothetical protein